MSRAQKQMVVLEYLKIKYPTITVGQAARLLNNWEFKCGNVLSLKV